MKKIKLLAEELRSFLILWSTQSLSVLGSSMTNFALVIWTYEEKGSALTTALLTVCSYAPYVLFSIFAGTLSDRWNKKITMLASDAFAACCTVSVFVLLKSGCLEIWHLYGINALNGLMNTVQQPASDVTVSLITPKKHYQKASGLKSFSQSLNNMLAPAAAAAIYSTFGLEAVIGFDLATFAVAFATLIFFVEIPETETIKEKRDSVLKLAKEGIFYLRENRGIMDLMLFLAAINLTASMYNAAFPAMLLSREGGGENALALVNACTGAAMMAGSFLASLLPAPESRVRVICATLLFSMSTENFILAFGRSAPVWCFAAVCGWLLIPVMNANMDVLLREYIPVPLQGRVYSVRNTLQFFTIPVGYLLGGLLVDCVFEPFMGAQSGGWLISLFGQGKGSGAALFFFCIGFVGVFTCLFFRRDRHIWALEERR